ncbi:hypothetical protein AAT19DRAFT_11636 [Rhodotorula toruloides]|uniref:Uncharacterized protein n=1 Tax=Rhodotorula toruloides TaxID=5286 RepID=A0A2S9ZW82_RHOTO|nr:hypothetical protein AAT19DRAFT_11636 [Rhodotorula toruloides]
MSARLLSRSTDVPLSPSRLPLPSSLSPPSLTSARLGRLLVAASLLPPMAHDGRHSPAYGHTLASSVPVWSFKDFTAYVRGLLQPVFRELDRQADSQPSQAAVISRRVHDLTNWQTALCGARGGRTWEAVEAESGIVPYHVQVNLHRIVQVLQALPSEVEAAPMLGGFHGRPPPTCALRLSLSLAHLAADCAYPFSLSTCGPRHPRRSPATPRELNSLYRPTSLGRRHLDQDDSRRDRRCSSSLGR